MTRETDRADLIVSGGKVVKDRHGMTTNQADERRCETCKFEHTNICVVDCRGLSAWTPRQSDEAYEPITAARILAETEGKSPVACYRYLNNLRGTTDEASAVKVGNPDRMANNEPGSETYAAAAQPAPDVVEAVARAIAPKDFRIWQSCYDYGIANGDTEQNARATADMFHKKRCDEAFEAARVAIKTYAALTAMQAKPLPEKVREVVTRLVTLDGWVRGIGGFSLSSATKTISDTATLITTQADRIAQLEAEAKELRAGWGEGFATLANTSLKSAVDRSEAAEAQVREQAEKLAKAQAAIRDASASPMDGQQWSRWGEAHAEAIADATAPQDEVTE